MTSLFMRHKSFLLGCLFFTSCSLANADWNSFNSDVVNTQIIPGYERLQSSASSLDKAREKFCRNKKDTQAYSSFKNSYAEFGVAWQAVQHIRFGPISYAKRDVSIQFWPDKKGYSGKRIHEFKKNTDIALSEQEFPTSRFSIGALNVLERILYSKEPIGNRSCELLALHTQNVLLISSELAVEWKESMRKQFEDPRQLDGFFEDEIDAATALLKGAAENLEVISALKLLRPMGSSAKKAKFQRLEAWRSGLSLPFITENLDVSIAMIETLQKNIPNAELSSTTSILESAKNRLMSINLPLAKAIKSNEQYRELKDIAQDLIHAHSELENTLTKMGIHLGFNSRDGD